MLVVPPMEGKRWWIMQIIDAWNDVPAAPGSRTHGGKGGNFALVGPNFKGTLPAGLEEIRVDTSLVAIGGRTYTGGNVRLRRGPQDPGPVQADPALAMEGRGHELHAARQRAGQAGRGRQDAGPAQVFKMSAEQFFGRLCELLVNNPARAGGCAVMARLAKIGIKPGAKFTTAGFDADTRKAIDEGVAAAQQAIRAEEAKMGEMVNGWQIARDLGRYGTKYTYRAAWTFFAVGGNLVEDAIYPLTLVDSDGNKLTGANKYVLHFARTRFRRSMRSGRSRMYDKDTYLVDNPINRYALGDRSNMKFGDDGSLTIYIQSESPGKDKESNWLPSPKGRGIQDGPAAVRSEEASHRRNVETAGGAAGQVLKLNRIQPPAAGALVL